MITAISALGALTGYKLAEAALKFRERARLRALVNVNDKSIR